MVTFMVQTRHAHAWFTSRYISTTGLRSIMHAYARLWALKDAHGLYDAHGHFWKIVDVRVRLRNFVTGRSLNDHDHGSKL